jgi:hypothetical protein
MTPELEIAMSDPRKPIMVADKKVKRRLCQHRTELDEKRITVYCSGLKCNRFKLTPAIMEDFCKMLIQENGVYEKLFAEKKVAGLFVWDAELTGLIDQQVRQALPARNQKVTIL